MAHALVIAQRRALHRHPAGTAIYAFPPFASPGWLSGRFEEQDGPFCPHGWPVCAPCFPCGDDPNEGGDWAGGEHIRGGNVHTEGPQ